MKHRDAWERLIDKLKGDLTVCNCGDAYGTPREKPLPPICEGGCDAARARAKRHIAKVVLGESE
jgi:hypothetical protein